MFTTLQEILEIWNLRKNLHSKLKLCLACPVGWIQHRGHPWATPVLGLSSFSGSSSCLPVADSLVPLPGHPHPSGLTPTFSCRQIISCSVPRLHSLSIKLFCLPVQFFLSRGCEVPESRGLLPPSSQFRPIISCPDSDRGSLINVLPRPLPALTNPSPPSHLWLCPPCTHGRLCSC